MKLKTITYQDGKPSFKQINELTNSNYAIGIKVNDKDGVEIPLSAPDIQLVDGETVISPSKMKNGYVLFIMESGNEPFDRKYDVKVNVAGITTNEVAYCKYTALNIAGGWRWSQGSTQNFTTDDLIGKTFDTSTFENLIMKLNIKDSDGNIVGGWEKTIKEWCEGRTTDKGIQFTIGSTNYLYFISAPGATYPTGLSKWDGEKFVAIDSFKVDDTFTFAYTSIIKNEYVPSMDDYKQYSPITMNLSLKTASTNIDTPFTLTINELKSNVGDVEGIVFDQTIRMSGTFVDGKEFSYDIPVK